MKLRDYARLLSRVIHKKNGSLPEYVIFFVTDKCNARCERCFYWDSLNKNNKELSIKEIEQVSKSMGRFLYLSLTGGEPFIREDLDQIIKIFHKNNGVNTIAISTNASLTTPTVKVVKSVLEDPSCDTLNLVVNISLDGLREEHDKVRKLKGNFDMAMKTYNLLKEIKKKHPNLSLGIRMTYHALNQDKINEVYAYSRDVLNPDSINVSLIRGDPKNPVCKNIDLDGYERLSRRIEEDYYYKKVRGYRFFMSKVTSALNMVVRNIVMKTARTRSFQSVCYAGDISCVIYSNGDIYPCELLPNMKIENLYDYGLDFKKLWNSVNAERIRRWIVDTKCNCTHECFITSNVLFNPEYIPELTYRLARLYLTRPKQYEKPSFVGKPITVSAN